MGDRCIPDLQARLRAGTITDAEFDGLFPPLPRAVSAQCWSPLAVIRRAVELFALPTDGYPPVDCAVDFGSGCGKMVIAAALLKPTIEWIGVERHEDLVDVARQAAQDAGLECGASFLHGGLEVVDFSFRAAYFYNPYEDGAYDKWVSLESTDAEVRQDCLKSIGQTQELLKKTELGTRVVTCNGFGGEMPEGFCFRHEERVGLDLLELWVREDIPESRIDRRPAALPGGLSPEARALLCIERYQRLAMTRQGLIGVELGLISADEYQSCPRGQIDEWIFIRARDQGRMADLETAIYAAARPSIILIP